LTELKAPDLPEAWQEEFADELRRTPEAGGFCAPGNLRHQQNHSRVWPRIAGMWRDSNQRWAGTWGLSSSGCRPFFRGPAADWAGLRCHPRETATGARHAGAVEGSRRASTGHPIVWAQHDDGHYLGGLHACEIASKLDDARAAVRHHPLDSVIGPLLRKSAKQVWKSTKDQPLRETCRTLPRLHSACKTGSHESVFGSMDYRGTQFARETLDTLIDRRLTISRKSSPAVARVWR